MDSKADVSQRHQDEWQRFRRDYIEPEFTLMDEKTAKVVKLQADILKIYQEGERKAYGFADGLTDNSMTLGWLPSQSEADNCGDPESDSGE